jgi:hypothetical protein
LDSGAFIAAERRDRRLAALIAAAEREGATMLLPAAVVAEVWRQPPRQLSAELLGTVDHVVALDDRRARAVGVLLGIARSAQIVDASVATLAISTRPSLVLTSDPKDLQALVRAAGMTCSTRARASASTAVILELL